MLTSLLLGLTVMVLYKPRTWCAFCPIGTMTQGDLQAEKQRIINDNRKESFSWLN